MGKKKGGGRFLPGLNTGGSTPDKQMNQEEEAQISWEIIAIASVLMLLVIWVGVNLVLLVRDSHPKHPTINKPIAVSASLKDTVTQKQTITPVLTVGAPVGARSRTLKKFHKLRAYPGAPPQIPHPVVEVSGKMENCLSCHKKGGFVPQFKAYAPVTPHPHFLNCVQCHVPAKTKAVFRPTGWSKLKSPRLGRSSLPGGPPPVPHSLQLRTQCNTCHSGPAAVKEIRTPHPQRSNCLQCHVPKRTSSLFRSRLKP
jgi:nitrate reductase cytochrome c-type subunit